MDRPLARRLLAELLGSAFLAAIVIGSGIAAQRLNLSGSFWSWLAGIDINQLGLAIVVLFAATWAIALAVWHFGRVEQRLGARLPPAKPAR